MAIEVPLVVMKVTSVSQLRPRRVPVPVSDNQSLIRVADVACTEVVRVPGWFTVAQARRVAELKRVSHVLVEDRGQVSGAISALTLAHAPANDTVARWMNRNDAHVSPEASIAAAELLLRTQGISCLPVVTGGLLVGTVTLHDLPEIDDDFGEHRAA